MNVRVHIPKFVRIPTSELGADGSIGEVVSGWSNTIAVRFDKHLGHYTVVKHCIHSAEEDTCVWYMAVLLILGVFDEQN